MKELLAGAHMSIAGGMHKAFERGAQVHCKTIQIFLKNSNQWKAKPLTEEARILFQEAQRASGISPVLAHDSYLINLASPNSFLYKKSINAFVEELRRANFLGVPYLVLHPGAHTGAGIDAGIEKAASALTQALELVEPPVIILLENTAGQGSSLGSRFEELAAILDRTGNPDRIGFCLDTCHAFAAGYDLRDEDAYRITMREFDRLIGIGKILAFHVNDSRKDLGCRVDRHCHIGKGFLGLQAFRLLVNDPRFEAIPKILETPKGEGFREDRRNLATLRKLVDSRLEIRGPKIKKAKRQASV
jgi:deoxyribonuclease-4